MKYSKEFFMLIAHLNPAIYDFIFPHGPIQHVHLPATRQLKTTNYQTQGSIFGTDLSGELHLLAKLTWKMKNLTEDLRAIVTQAKVSDQGTKTRGFSTFVSEIVDDYCGTGVKKIPFPPKPRWFDDEISVDEKVYAATIISQAAAAVKGTELETYLNQGAEKIMDSALAEFTALPALTLEAAHN